VTNNEIMTSIKDERLIEKRRNQMIQGAITLFKKKGFHRTTTREIAKESGFSIGTLYEYIRTKEDVLFLVVDAIYDKVKKRLMSMMHIEDPSIEHLMRVIDSYFRVVDDMQEEIIIMYQEVKSLQKHTQEYVLQKERDMVHMLQQLIQTCAPKVSKADAELMANNIFVQGHMWGFRRWALHKPFTLDEYIERQLEYLQITIKNL